MSIEKGRYIDAVKNAYGSYVERGGDGDTVLKIRGEALGYTESFLMACHMNMNMNRHPSSSIQKLFAAFCGSGCPLRIDEDRHLPQRGDVVVDLGCGAGQDSILAGGLVGTTGHVFGVDFTQAMLDQSHRNVGMCANVMFMDTSTAKSKSEAKRRNITFCRGSIDDPSDLIISHAHVGLTDGIADVVISNGVFNLCTNVSLAFQSAFLLLKPGGKLLLSDLCIVEDNPNAVISCTIGDEATS
jgi:SAM-dependent methyltransferase